jgi:hypothetical protein
MKPDNKTIQQFADQLKKYEWGNLEWAELWRRTNNIKPSRTEARELSQKLDAVNVKIHRLEMDKRRLELEKNVGNRQNMRTKARELSKKLHATLKLRWRYTKSFPEIICRRVSDGTFWIASSNGMVASMLSLFGVGDKFFFRRIYRLNDTWVADFDNTWQFSDWQMFDILSERKHKVWVRRKQWRRFLATL